MDYIDLASEFLQKMFLLRKSGPHRQINESMQGESFVLKYMFRQAKPVLPSEISNFMKISTARTATALNSLERKGLVTRQIDPNDRRQILVTLTEKGKLLAEEQKQKVMDRTVYMLNLLGEKDAQEFVRIVGKLADVSSKLREEKNSEE
ncbi:MAG: MarR family transcriptional regulator [Clostridiales bacterium]|nr:MAG: MarR family transcriptional regulator [Clostridiales bacterium]